MKRLAVALGILVLSSVFADELEPGFSISHFYQAQSLFTNPAALAYQTELNGFYPAISLQYARNQTESDSFSFATTWGLFGTGFQRLPLFSSEMIRRYSFGMGIPINSYLYAGIRYSLNRAEKNPGNSFDSVDAGLQLRPSSFFSIGLLANQINQSTVSIGQLPTLFGGGVTIRPVDPITLTADFFTPSNQLGKTWTEAGYVVLEPIPGLSAKAGYHSEQKWQFSLQLSFGQFQTFGHYLPSADRLRAVGGVNWQALPMPSLISSPKAMKIEVASNLEEEGRGASLFQSGKPSLFQLLHHLWEIGERKDIKKVLLKINRFSLGLAAASEIYSALEQLRKKGVEIEVYLQAAGIKEYLIASVANRVHLDPGGEIRLLGLRAERYFLKGTLDKIGIEAEIFAKGKYKSAPEALTLKKSSDVSRSSTLEEIREAESTLVPMLTRYRTQLAGNWKQLLQQALFSPQDAMAMKLIDNVTSYPAAVEKAGEEWQITESIAQQKDLLQLPNRIAILAFQGAILEQSIPILGLFGQAQSITPKGFETRLKRAVGDPRTRAIIIRVDSPGGEVLASHQIAALIERAREKKPVIISMGDLAASGGYLISAPGEKIFANPFSMTGSIGVFLGKANASSLYKKLDLNKEILSDAPRAGLYSEDRPLNSEEQKIFNRRLEHYYNSFIEYVGTSRRMTFAETDSAAQGRVWLGESARRRKLVDELGGLQEAVTYAENAAHLRPGSYELWEVLPKVDLFSFSTDDFGLMSSQASLPFLKGLGSHLSLWTEAPLYYSELGPLE